MSPPDKQEPVYVPSSLLANIYNRIFVKDSWIGTLLGLLIILILLANVVARSGASLDGFQAVLDMTYKPLLFLLGVLVLSGAIRHRVYSHVLAISIFLLAFLFLVNVLSRDRLLGVKTICILNFHAKDLNSPECRAVGIAEANVTIPSTSPIDLGPTASNPPSTPAVHSGKVFLQFAGPLKRETVIKVANQLAADGWNVQQPERGGERIASALGLNEVRYFHPEDRAAAEALAREFSASAGWLPAGTLGVRDMSKSGIKSPVGQLEIWTSI